MAATRQPYQLVWAVGLLWYGISAGTEFLGGAYGWNEPLYRVWYLIGAFGVAAYLGLGTVWLLRNTRFGYFVAFSVFAGGLFSILAGLARAKEGDPASATTVLAVVAFCAAAAIALAVATRVRRRGGAAGDRLLLIAVCVVAVLTLTVPVDAPGYARIRSRRADRRGLPAGPARHDAAVQHRRRLRPVFGRSTPPTSSCPRTG